MSNDTPRRARLEVSSGKTMMNRHLQYVHLVASNGEPLMNGETLANGERGRKAVLDAMIQVLQDEGYTVEPSVNGAHTRPRRGE